MPESRLHQLSALGQSVWIDSLSREWLETGELERMLREDAVVGVTSNPTIFQKAMAEGERYDEQLREVLETESDPKEIFLQLAVRDIQAACDLFRTVWDEGKGQDGYVSLEVDPTLAHETGATVEEAQRLHEWVDRPNLHVKIPATKGGLPAIEEMIARGRNINVTLIFSLQRYAEVAEAYVKGLERLVKAGGDPGTVASVASFFVSRVDTEADKRLVEAGHPELKGKLAIANAKLAYQRYKEIFSGSRWENLAAKGATKQRCLWASTSTKDPEYRDVMYVEELIGPETVNTMPKETVEAFQDHGEVKLTLEQGIDESRALFRKLAEIGVSYDDISDTLEREGVEKFADSFQELIDGIEEKRKQLAPRVSPLDVAELVDRIWARDPTVWTGTDEASWLGWLDEPNRMLERLDEFQGLDGSDYESVVLLGMGGSSLGPEVLRRTFAIENFHVLDTTHPSAIRELEQTIDVEGALFVAASKSGSTLETRCQLDYFLKRGRGFAAITDPGSELEAFAREHDFEWVIAGEPTIGGRYSVLSPFGMVPATLMGLDVRTLLDRAAVMAEWCRLANENPGADLGAQLGGGWAEGRDKICFADTPGGIGLWIEQLHRGVDGQGRQGPRAGTGRVARGSRSPGGERQARRSLRHRRGVLPLGVRNGGRRVAHRHQPVQPAGRPGGEGPHHGDPRARRRRPGAGELGRGALRPGSRRGLHRDPRVHRSRSRRRARTARHAGARDRAARSRSGSARGTCTRPASCTRAVPTRSSRFRSWTTWARS